MTEDINVGEIAEALNGKVDLDGGNFPNSGLERVHLGAVSSSRETYESNGNYLGGGELLPRQHYDTIRHNKSTKRWK